jgi:hypothetical protein
LTAAADRSPDLSKQFNGNRPVTRRGRSPVFNAADGFLEAARQADLEHVVLLSSAAVT